MQGMLPLPELGPNAYTDGNVIAYEGTKYYRLCGFPVYNKLNGDQAPCIKQHGHISKMHEAIDGTSKLVV